MPEDWDRQLAVLGESLVVLPRLAEEVEPDRLHRSPAPESISFRRYVLSRGRHDLVHIEQIRSALSG